MCPVFGVILKKLSNFFSISQFRTELTQNSAESQDIELYEVRNEHITIDEHELIRTGEDVVMQVGQLVKAVEELYKKINVDFKSGVLYHNCSSHCNEYVTCGQIVLYFVIII